MRTESLAELFCMHLPEPLRAAAHPPDLDSRLQALTATAQKRWPNFTVPTERFLAYLAARAPVEGGFETWLTDPHAEELYLTCACAQGDARALLAFEQHYFSEIDRACAQLRASAAAAVEVDDLKQSLRERLFVSGPDRAPKIAEYAGHGALRNWIRVVISRAVINLIQRTPRNAPLSEDVLFTLPLLTLDPELAYLKERYRVELAAALREAIQSLSGRQRTLLRYQLADGLNRDRIGAIYHVHGATAARWLQQARTDLKRHLRRALLARLHVHPTELDSILRLMHSQIDLLSLQIG